VGYNFFKLYAFILLTSTLVPGINYFVVTTHPLHDCQFSYWQLIGIVIGIGSWQIIAIIDWFFSYIKIIAIIGSISGL